MKIHKNTKLLPNDKIEIFQKYYSENYRITELAEEYRVSRPTIYKVLNQVRKGEYYPKSSTNHRYRNAKYGIKRLIKAENRISNAV